MPKLWRSLEEKALANDATAGARFMGNAVRTTVLGQTPWLGWSTAKAVTDGYEREPQLFRAIHALATAIGRLPCVLRKDDAWYGEIIDTTEDPLLRLLNRNAANDMESGFQFRYRLTTLLMLSQRGVFVERVTANRGSLQALRLLPADITNPIPPTLEQLKANPGKLIDHYEVIVPGFQKMEIPTDDVVWIRWPHPTDVFSGITPLRALALTIDTANAARLYNRRFLAKDGRPGGLVAIKGGMDREEKQELRRRLSGIDNVGETSVVQSEQVSYIDLAARPRDMAYKELRPAMKEEIYSGIGTPESIAGNASGRTFDNADAERENWYVDDVMPTFELITQALSVWTSEPDPDVVLGADTSKIAVLARFDRERNTYHLQEGLSGAITRTEYRKDTGRAALTKEEMDDLFIPNPDATPPAAGGPGGGGVGPDGNPMQPGQGVPGANGGNAKLRPAILPRLPGGAGLSKDGHDALVEGVKAVPLELDVTRPRGFARRRTSGLRR